jgi:hypothetical protein
MIDLSEFRDAPKKSCVVRKFVTTLSTTEQEQFQAALEVEEISTASIVRWLMRRGATFRENVVYNHRKSQCPCQ